MKEAEDDGEIVIKNMFFHLMTGKKKVHATRDIYLAMLEVARKTRRCAVPHIMTPSPRTMETSVDVVEIFDQKRVLADLGTQILEGIMTFLVERNSERIDDQTVDLLVQQKGESSRN